MTDFDELLQNQPDPEDYPARRAWTIQLCALIDKLGDAEIGARVLAGISRLRIEDRGLLLTPSYPIQPWTIDGSKTEWPQQPLYNNAPHFCTAGSGEAVAIA